MLVRHIFCNPAQDSTYGEGRTGSDNCVRSSWNRPVSWSLFPEAADPGIDPAWRWSGSYPRHRGCLGFHPQCGRFVRCTAVSSSSRWQADPSVWQPKIQTKKSAKTLHWVLQRHKILQATQLWENCLHRLYFIIYNSLFLPVPWP